MGGCSETIDSEPTATARKRDWLLVGSLSGVVILYLAYLTLAPYLTQLPVLLHLSHSVFDLINTIWWGIALGFLMICIISRVPREFVMSILGTQRGFKGLWRATMLGVLLDLCSHGVLMVGSRLYERGASAGQVMAFLLSSPWNSLSFTLILIALVGLPWTIAFIFLSMIVALITGMVFELLNARGVLPENTNHVELADGFRFWPSAKEQLAGIRVTPAYILEVLRDGLKNSRMVMRWILFGVLLASIVRALIPLDVFESLFGPTLIGLGLTVIVATIMEVCSEGSTPIAADLLTRAHAPGNSFAFLMGGVVTDYTEIAVLKEATASWKIALFLPLIALPQVVLLSVLINLLHGNAG